MQQLARPGAGLDRQRLYPGKSLLFRAEFLTQAQLTVRSGMCVLGCSGVVVLETSDEVYL